MTESSAVPATPAPASADELEAVDPQAVFVDERVTRGVWRLIAGVLLTAFALWFLHMADDLVRYLILSQLLAFALEPGVNRLHTRRNWRRGTATAAVLGGVALVFILLGLQMFNILGDQLNQGVDDVPELIAGLNDFTQEHFDTTIISGTDAEASAQATDHLSTYLKDHAGDLLGGLGNALGAVFSLFTIAMFTFYLTADGPKIRQVLLSRLPPHRQRNMLWAWNTAIDKTGGYLYSRGLLALINGALIFVTMVLVDTPYPLPLAVFSGVVAAFIPIVGTYIAGALPVIVTLSAVGWGPALIILAEVLLYQQLENFVISPLVSKETMELNPGIAYGAAMAGGAVGGFIGAFFALPIAAIIQAFLSTYARRFDVIEEGRDGDGAPAPPPENA